MTRAFPVLGLCYLAALLVLHAMPTGGLDLNATAVGGVRFSHFLHAAMFLPWCYLGLCFVHRSPRRRIWRGVGWLLLGGALAAGAEAVQIWLPHRAFTPADMIANLGGLVMGTLAWLVWRPRCMDVQARPKARSA